MKLEKDGEYHFYDYYRDVIETIKYLGNGQFQFQNAHITPSKSNFLAKELLGETPDLAKIKYYQHTKFELVQQVQTLQRELNDLNTKFKYLEETHPEEFI